jgi:hypothetical protein
LKSVFDGSGSEKKPRPFPKKRTGREPYLLGGSLVSWSRSGSARAAGGREEGCDGGNDGKFDHVHISCVVCWLLKSPARCWPGDGAHVSGSR